MRYFYFLLFSISVFSQSKPIEIKIDSIKTSTTEEGDRKFTIQYSIANKSDKPASFVLNTNAFIPINGGSLTPAIYYKLYENNASLDISGVFTGNKTTRYFKDEEEFKRFEDSMRVVMKNRTAEDVLKRKKEIFLNNIQKLEAKETKHFTEVLVWNKNRYFRNDVYEYYIEEKEKHFLELHINLMTEELLMGLTENEKKEILKDKNLTKGWYTSNKVEIDLGK